MGAGPLHVTEYMVEFCRMRTFEIGDISLVNGVCRVCSHTESQTVLLFGGVAPMSRGHPHMYERGLLAIN